PADHLDGIRAGRTGVHGGGPRPGPIPANRRRGAYRAARTDVRSPGHRRDRRHGGDADPRATVRTGTPDGCGPGRIPDRYVDDHRLDPLGTTLGLAVGCRHHTHLLRYTTDDGARGPTRRHLRARG